MYLLRHMTTLHNQSFGEHKFLFSNIDKTLEMHQKKIPRLPNRGAVLAQPIIMTLLNQNFH